MNAQAMNLALAGCVNQCRAGDLRAFDTIYQRLQPSVRAHAWRLMADSDDADDVTATTFLKLYRTIGTVRSGTNITALVYRICTNAGLDIMRHRMLIRFVPWDAPFHDPLQTAAPIDEPERAAECAETTVMVRAVLAAMSHRHRTALILREFRGMTYDEITAAMGVSRKTTKSILHRARLEFRYAYRQIAVGEPVYEPRQRGPVKRGRVWQPPEDAALRAGQAAGEPWSVIGERIGRPGDQCYDRAYRLGILVRTGRGKQVAS